MDEAVCLGDISTHSKARRRNLEDGNKSYWLFAMVQKRGHSLVTSETSEATRNNTVYAPQRTYIPMQVERRTSETAQLSSKAKYPTWMGPSSNSWLMLNGNLKLWEQYTHALSTVILEISSSLTNLAYKYLIRKRLSWEGKPTYEGITQTNWTSDRSSLKITELGGWHLRTPPLL